MMSLDINSIEQTLDEFAPILEHLKPPVRLFSLGSQYPILDADVQSGIDTVASDKGYGGIFDYPSEKPKNASCFEHLLSERILNSGKNPKVQSNPNVHEYYFDKESSLKIYDCGEKSNTPIMLVIPCGMPVMLADKWIAKLSRKYRVLTWESRGLFGRCENFDAMDTSLAAQDEDLILVLDHLDIPKAHLMGLCGGAAIALAAASEQPDRVISLSLWHGDLNFGEDIPKTTHQMDVMAMLQKVGTSRDKAKGMFALFSRPAVLETIKREIGHYVLYPYASPELLYRYGKLNGNIMTADLRPYLQNIAQPTLVVTSKKDSTAHPEGSFYTHRNINGSTLYLADDGDHLSMFEAPRHLVGRATSFISKVSR